MPTSVSPSRVSRCIVPSGAFTATGSARRTLWLESRADWAVIVGGLRTYRIDTSSTGLSSNHTDIAMKPMPRLLLCGS
jgi:hypothetical protein